MKQSGILVSAGYVKEGQKNGVPRPHAVAANVVYGNKLDDQPEFIWLSPADDHMHILQLKKYAPVEVEGRIQNGRFFVDTVKATNA